MGLTNPSDLTQGFVTRRISETYVKPLSAIYQYLLPGQLLTDNIPEDYKIHWSKASADRF